MTSTKTNNTTTTTAPQTVENDAQDQAATSEPTEAQEEAVELAEEPAGGMLFIRRSADDELLVDSLGLEPEEVATIGEQIASGDYYNRRAIALEIDEGEGAETDGGDPGEVETEPDEAE